MEPALILVKVLHLATPIVGAWLVYRLFKQEYRSYKRRNIVTFTDPKTNESVTVSTKGDKEDGKKLLDFMDRVDRKNALHHA